MKLFVDCLVHCTIYWVFFIEIGEAEDDLKGFFLEHDVVKALDKTPGAYHWARGIVKVSLSTHNNVQMGLVRAKRQVLDSTPQQRLKLDQNAKEYLKSTLTIAKAQQMQFPVQFINKLWPNAAGLLYTIIMLP